MQGLLQAINNLFQGNASLQAALPGYTNPGSTTPACACNFWWADEVPENCPFPYCAGSVVASPNEPLYPNQSLGLANYGPNNTTIRFTVYASTLNAAMTAAEAMVAVLLVTVPTMPSGSSITNMFCSQDPTPLYEGKDKNVGDVYRADVLFVYSPSVP